MPPLESENRTQRRQIRIVASRSQTMYRNPGPLPEISHFQNVTGRYCCLGDIG